MDSKLFREIFPEFSDTEQFSDPTVTYWLNLAEKMLPENRWGDMYQHGIGLYAAHFMVLGKKNEQSAQTTGVPTGMATGMMASKSVDKVSVSYAQPTFTMDNAGHWNVTIYGIQLLTFARQVAGLGSIQL